MTEATLNTSVIDHTLIASIAQILSNNNIPCILWGNCLLTVYGVPSIVNSIDFVVPDELIPAAVAALQDTGLGGCTEPKTCGAIREFRPSPPPAAHFHINVDFTVSLYEKSSALWFLPSLSLSHGPEDSENIILASDSRLPAPKPGRGPGAFHPELYPVCIPSAHRLLEAYIRLIANTHGRAYEYFWMAMVTYIAEYVDGDALLDEARLEKRCRVFYEGFKSFERPLATLLEELEASFAEAVDEPLVSIPQPEREADEVEVTLLEDRGQEKETEVAEVKVTLLEYGGPEKQSEFAEGEVRPLSDGSSENERRVAQTGDILVQPDKA